MCVSANRSCTFTLLRFLSDTFNCLIFLNVSKCHKKKQLLFRYRRLEDVYLNDSVIHLKTNRNNGAVAAARLRLKSGLRLWLLKYFRFPYHECLFRWRIPTKGTFFFHGRSNCTKVHETILTLFHATNALGRFMGDIKFDRHYNYNNNNVGV